MAKVERKPQSGAFRIPNSIVQGLTTDTAAELNRLTAFQMVILFGLLANVSQNHPEREALIKLCKILEIIEVSKQVAHAVERQWVNGDGQDMRRCYRASRFSPSHRERVQAALLTLFNQTVVIRRRGDRDAVEDRLVHILDSFGYRYAIKGQVLDLDNLPDGRERINVGSDDRPVWRIRRTNAGDRFENPSAILFQINGELAREISRRKGTIKSTIFARQVFGLFRKLARSPVAVRLLILVLRQTDREFVRNLSPLLADLGGDISHRQRAICLLAEALEQLRGLSVVDDFRIDEDADRVAVLANRDWYLASEA